MLVQLLIKLKMCPLIWPVLLSHILFSIVNWEGGGQSSMNLTKSYPEITLPFEDCGDYRIKKLDTQ